MAEAGGALSVRCGAGWTLAALSAVRRECVSNAPFTRSLKFVGLASRLAETALETIGTMLTGITRNAVVAGLARARGPFDTTISLSHAQRLVNNEVAARREGILVECVSEPGKVEEVPYRLAVGVRVMARAIG